MVYYHHPRSKEPEKPKAVSQKEKEKLWLKSCLKKGIGWIQRK